MWALLIVLLLICGFLYGHCSPKLKYKFIYLDGQYLYLSSLKYGIISISKIGLLVFSGYYYFRDKYAGYIDYLYNILLNHKILNDRLLVEIYCLFIVVIILSFVISPLLSFIYKLRFSFHFKKKNKVNYELYSLLKFLESNNPFEFLLYKLYSEKKLVMFFLNDRKVYMGLIIALSDMSSKNSYEESILLSPIFSGYRDKDTLEVKITTDYNIETSLSLMVSIRKKDILTIREFEPEIFSNFQGQKKNSKLKQILKILKS